MDTLIFGIVFFLLCATAPVSPQFSSRDLVTRTRQLEQASNVFDFHGDGYIHFDISNYARQSRHIQISAQNESFTLQFATRVSNALIWLDRRADSLMYLYLRDGYLVFIIEEGSYPRQEIVLQSLRIGDVNDRGWHEFSIKRTGLYFRFYIDQILVGETVTRRELPLIYSGTVYLGGTPDNPQITSGRVRGSFDGALTRVVYEKIVVIDRLTTYITISLLKYAQDWHGNITVIPANTPAPPIRTPSPPIRTPSPPIRTPRPPIRTPRPPVTPSPSVQLISIITIRSSVLHLQIPGMIDFRRGGSISFRFRTFEDRGLIFYTRRNTTASRFCSIEIFDGKLFFVYNFGGRNGRVQISENIVNDGNWHSVRIQFTQTAVVVYLDDQPMSIRLSAQDLSYIVMDGGLFIGNLPATIKMPWILWSRKGFVGCFSDLRLINVDTNIRGAALIPTNIPEIQRGCVTMTRECDRNPNPCSHGVCYNQFSSDFLCNCAATGYQGNRCNQFALAGGFEGSNHVVHYYATTQITHTNDISLRFNTPFPDAFLFQTVSDRYDDFIRGELEGGRLKITFRVGGNTETWYTGSGLGDKNWHNLHFKRRGNEVELWVDEETHVTDTLPGEDFFFHFGKIYFGNLGNIVVEDIAPNYIGYLQNVYFDQTDIFSLLRQRPSLNIIWIENENQFDYSITYNPITITTREAYLQFRTLRVGRNFRLTFKFRTRDPNGVIIYNKGQNDKFLSVELVNGYIHFGFNNGYRPTKRKINKKVDDNKWHMFELMEVNQGGSRKYVIHVDDVREEIPIVGSGKLGLTGPLYIGGLSENMFLRDAQVQRDLRSKHGFMGCLASMDLNHAVPSFDRFSGDNALIVGSCKDISGVCPATSEVPCQNGGLCIPGVTTYNCNCDMTGYAGPTCSSYPLGMYFMKNGQTGILTYKFKSVLQSEKDNIAFGFMTYQDNGILARFDSLIGAEYIEIRLENGFLVATFNTGNGPQTILLDNKQYNDGNYHVITFVRDHAGAYFSVDDYNRYIEHTEAFDTRFDQLQYVFIGGRQDSNGATMSHFNGIIGGMYWNGYRFIDLAHANNNNLEWIGDLTLIGENGYILVPPVVVTVPPTSIPTRPPPSPIPPSGGTGIVIPPDIGGAGVVGPGAGGPAVPGGSVVGIGGAGTGITGGGGFVSPGSGGPPITGALTGASGGPPVPLAAGGGGGAGGARAGALMGTILGTMAFAASLLWAFWQCKPGMIPCFGGKPAGAGAGGGAPSMAISSPTTTNLPVAQALGGAPGGAGAGSGSGGGAKVTILNGSASSGGAGGGGGGGSGSAFTAYYSSSGASASSATAGGAGGSQTNYDATLRATGTFTNKGTVIGTPKAVRANLGSSSTAGGGGGGGGSSTYSYSAKTTNVYSGGSTGGGSAVDGVGWGESTTADYDMAGGMPGGNYQSNTLNVQNTGGSTTKGYSSSTMSSSYNYQVQNVRTVMMGGTGGGHHLVSYNTSSSGAVTPGAAGDEVRVDCCMMTGDGNTVVTGSSLGPPQVWDMSTGELLRIMKGDTVGSTNLHLACNDRLLVGAVHADLEINEFSTRKGVTNKKLQIWDFVTGKPLEMGYDETCSALCVMSDPDKVVFARSEKFGNATNIVIWDLLGNQAFKEMRYDVPVGNNDYINFIAMSKNDRYCVAGYTNTFDNYAEFVVFDAKNTSYNITEPNLLKLDANPDCTVILPRDEAVTGLRNGDLVVWGLRTGQPSRQLLSSSGMHAHDREIKAVAISEDSAYLVSASADGTLKIWDMDTERHIKTLKGHNDEVWCVAISPDNEIVVSGSRDGSIRLWRIKTGQEICAFTTGVDVFYVTMSHDKGTIVALGDKFGARKLIMLQVVRTKIRRQISS